jgi:hypothetical protein
MKGIKKFILWSCLGAVLYLLMSYHFIFFGINCKVLRKSKLTLNNTFFSTQGRNSKSLISISDLREAGIADLLVKMGKITEQEKRKLMAEYTED